MTSKQCAPCGGSISAGDTAYLRDSDEWSTLQAAWKRQWFCSRCGQSFEPTAKRAAA